MPTLEIAWIVLVAGALIAACAACERHARYAARVRRAAETIRRAEEWERHGEVQRAYRAYCEVCDGGFRIDRADLPPDACDRVLPLYRTIVAAHDDTLRALDSYRDRVGRYPDRLEEVRAEIPEESLPAFRGFEYERKPDSDVSIVTGLYSAATFETPPRRDSRRA
jgi:hypothetical protein